MRLVTLSFSTHLLHPPLPSPRFASPRRALPPKEARACAIGQTFCLFAFGAMKIAPPMKLTPVNSRIRVIVLELSSLGARSTKKIRLALDIAQSRRARRAFAQSTLPTRRTRLARYDDAWMINETHESPRGNGHKRETEKEREGVCACTFLSVSRERRLSVVHVLVKNLLIRPAPTALFVLSVSQSRGGWGRQEGQRRQRRKKFYFAIPRRDLGSDNSPYRKSTTGLPPSR